MDAAHPSRHGLPEAESVRTDPPEQSRPHAAGALPQVRRNGGGGARGTLGKRGHRHVPPDGSRRRRRVHPPRLPPLRHSPSRRRRAVAIRQMKNVLWSRTTWIAARGVVAAIRPDRAVGLCLIALVLAQAGFFAGAPSDFAGSPVVLNRGARIPSVMSGTRDVVVPDGKANEPGLTVQDVSPVLGTGWNALSFEPGGLTPPDVQVAVGPAHVVEAVNIALGVYSKEGVLLVTYGLSTFFATGSDFLSDPRIEYDCLRGLWFVTIGDFTTAQVLVAASQSTDPTLGWSIDRVPSSATSECLRSEERRVG